MAAVQTPTVRATLRRVGSAGAVVGAATMTGNLLAYAVPVLGARRLDPATFGALAAIMSMSAIAAVPGIGLQTAVTMHRARGPVGRGPARLTAIAVAVPVSALVLLAPLLTWTLQLPWTAVGLVALITAPVVAAGRYLGDLQGTRRFGRLAVDLVLLAVARTAGIIGGLAAGAGLIGALLAGAAVAWLALAAIRAIHPADLTAPAALTDTGPAGPGPSGTGPSDTGPAGDQGRPGPGAGLASGRPGRAGLIRDLFAASNVTLAMFAVTNADLLAARYLLEPEQAGRYAVLSILTKGAIWAPQVVTVLALPRLARRVRHTTALATAAVAACGVLLVSAAAVAGPLAVRLVGGPRYVDLAGYAPAFAAAGALYALVFLLVNANLAGGGRAPAAPLWMGLAGFTAVVLSLPAPRIGSVVGVALGTAAVTTLAVISAARWVSQREHRT